MLRNLLKIKKMKKNILVIIIAIVVVSISGSAMAQQSGVKRVDLQRHDLSIPGREAVQARIDFAPGAIAPRHSHPGEEVIYVLEGLLEYQVEGKPPVTLKAGEVLFIPAGTIHSAKNVGTGNAKELATYVVEKGKPLVVLAK
jgi:quercetin dioxygenase-like cupin family protein